jgi:hypothetical protein
MPTEDQLRKMYPSASQETPAELEAARAEAEKRYPFLAKFRNRVGVAYSKAENKGGLGEFVGPADPGNPNPGKHTITVGAKSKDLQGGIADTIIADSVHAAADLDPEFMGMKKGLIESLSEKELDFARKKYESEYKGKFTGSNFETFDSFLRTFWADGIVQHLLLPENSEIDQIRKANPKAGRHLDAIKALFEGRPRKLGGH